jgi:hypothetical protein
MKVIRLKEFGQQRFEETLVTLCQTSTDRNKNWFPTLLKDYQLPKYLEWFFAIDPNGNVSAFSTIQDFGQKNFRLLTRCYVYENHRRPILPKIDTYHSPATFLIQDQLNFLNHDYESIFISLEHIRRRRTILNMSRKMALATGLDWSVGAGMFQTCNNKNSMNCWQNICYSKQCPNLDSITHDEWNSRYGKMSD